MNHPFFSYTQGYNYKEFACMCDCFHSVKLPGFSYEVKAVLSEYVFGYSMQRFPVGKKNVLRRMMGAMFSYPLRVNGEGNTAFLFTGDGIGRPDYVKCLEMVAAQCDTASQWVMDRKKPCLRANYLLGMLLIPVWALRLNRILHNFMISLDFAAGLYRAKKQGELIFKQMQRAGVRSVVTFCDAWSIESVVAQAANRAGMVTATLQHGNGTEIFYGSCSKYYLANSLLSRENCLEAGIPAERVIVTGPMKYAGQKFDYPDIDRVHTVGVVFDGAQNFENNVQMLEAVHSALVGTNIRCCIRFHPNNNREDYAPYLGQMDIICDDLAEFEDTIDLCVVYNSSMFTDMIYKHIPVCRFKNGKVDLFPQVQDTGFRDGETLRTMLKGMEMDLQGSLAGQKALYDLIFGDDCKSDSYGRFFSEKM